MMTKRKDEQSDYCPRLIEVALPIREISAESVRDKNIHHAHISHLHIWWARRPLAASRAIVFASLVPDPDDPRCPAEFRKAVERHLKTHVPSELQHYMRGRTTVRDEDPYRPYLPAVVGGTTKAGDGTPDTLRNRLLAFVAKWSPEAIAFETGKAKEEPTPAELLDDRSLVKWETSDPDNAQGRAVLQIARELVKLAYGGRTPTVLDPFSGGGAIPLEAGRLGCQAIANDYNPVAYLILRATCEFPQKYGKPGRRTVKRGDMEFETEVPNILVHDFGKWADWILERARKKIGDLYPKGKDGKQVVGYLWGRTAPCSNPSCRAEMPLLGSMLICSKSGKKVALRMDVDNGRKLIEFGIARGKDIARSVGTMQNRGNALCPFCEQVTPVADLRTAGLHDRMGERMVAVVVQGKDGKEYRPVEHADRAAFEKASALRAERPRELILPEINADGAEDNVSNSTGIRVHLYGMKTWGSLFNNRQLVAMQTFVACLHEAQEQMSKENGDVEYQKALALYLALWIDRIAVFGNRVSRWRSSHEKSETPFSGQAIPMIWDYPEANPFADSSGTASTQLRYMLKVIEHERMPSQSTIPRVILGSATTLPLPAQSVDSVVTDPPYDDAISYGDLSDFFYVWLKRMIAPTYPEAFSTPLTPKGEEATSLKHRHGGSGDKARAHYRKLLTASFIRAVDVARDPKLISVMFAHQSTDAWAALISALFDAGLSPVATWPIATEMPSTALALGTASLETSVTVACRPRIKGSAASYKTVRGEVEVAVKEAIKRFWSYGFRGADLIVACYGPAVGVFGKYDRVEKADGTRVGIPELLELARAAARDAIAGEFRADNLSTLYYVWTNLYGISEQAWDDARLVVMIGGEADNAMEVARHHGIFVVDGSTCRLALLADRAERRGLGVDPNPPLIDALHRAMLLWQAEKRSELVSYLSERDLFENEPFWKLAQALFEVLPRDLDDWKLVSALLGERQTLRVESKRVSAAKSQRGLFKET